MAAVDSWMKLEHSPTELGQTEKFEKEQQRRFLIELLATPSALYRHAAACGTSPVAYRLECWKQLADVQGVSRLAPAAPKRDTASEHKVSGEPQL